MRRFIVIPLKMLMQWRVFRSSLFDHSVRVDFTITLLDLTELLFDY